MKRGRNSKEALALAAVVIETDRSPRWFRALTEPVFTGAVTYKGVNVEELIAAARAVTNFDFLNFADARLPVPLYDAIVKLKGALPE